MKRIEKRVTLEKNDPSVILNLISIQTDSKSSMSKWSFATVIHEKADLDLNSKNNSERKCKTANTQKYLNFNFSNYFYEFDVNGGAIKFKGVPIEKNKLFTYYFFNPKGPIIKMYKISDCFSVKQMLICKTTSTELEKIQNRCLKQPDAKKKSNKLINSEEEEDEDEDEDEEEEEDEMLDESVAFDESDEDDYLDDDDDSDGKKKKKWDDYDEESDDYDNKLALKKKKKNVPDQPKNDFIFDELKSLNTQTQINQAQSIRSIRHLEITIKRYLMRKPITSTNLFIKCKKNFRGIESTLLSQNIAMILKKIKPNIMSVNGKLQFSID